MKYYYTAREAQQHLGLPVGAFYYLIDTGKIKRITPPGKNRGFYSRHQIERLAKEQMGSGNARKTSQLTFAQATQDDFYEEYELAALVLSGSASYGLPTSQAWMRKNPATNFIVRDQGRLVAFMHVIPVQTGTVKRWLNGEIREWEISADDVLPYIPGISVECLITNITIATDADRAEQCRYMLRLLRGFSRFLQDLARQHVTISRFYAAATTPEAMLTLQRAAFKERARIGRRVIFDLNPLASSFSLARAYRMALRRYQA
jgi:hypothetical protein